MQPTKLNPPTKEKINRLLIQQNGDSGFYLLSLFSFIEAYIRHNFTDYAYNDNQEDEKTYFPKLLRILEESDSPFDRFSKYHYLNSDLISLYSKYANKVRHNFGEIEDVTLASAVRKFLKFAKYHNFLTPELADLSNGSEFNSIKNHESPSGTNISEMQKENKKISEMYKNKEEEFNKQLELIHKIQEENKTLKEELDSQNKEISQIQKDAEEYLLNSRLILNYTQDYRDYQTRLLTLSSDQEKIISRIVKNISAPLEKDFLIKGGPGTGKTLVLIKILEKIIDSECRLLTYTSSLSKYNRYVSELYLDKNNTDESIVSKMRENISTFDEFFKIKLEVLLGKEVFFINPDSAEDIDSDSYKHLLELIEQTRTSSKFSAKSILEQAIDEIWANLLERDEYINATYATNVTLTEEQIGDRKNIWDSIMAAVSAMDNTSKVLADYAYWKINTDSRFDNIPDTHKVDFLLIDEIQDLSTARIELLSKLTRKNCVMAGDLNQSIFIKRGLSWKKLGYKVQGHTITLKTNYRSTMPIQKLANEYRNRCKIHDTNVISQSFIPGPEPELFVAESNNKAYNEIINKVSWCKNVMNFSHKDICIVTTNSGELSKVQTLLNEKNISSNIMESKDFEFKKDDDSIRLSTIKYVKGIDSPILILLLTDNLTNKKANGNMDSNAQMNCVYACITRAMDLLYVITTKDVANNHKSNKETSISHLIGLMN